MNSEVKDNEDLPYSNAVPTLSLPAPQSRNSASGEDEFTADDYRLALRLLVGAALEGGDELSERIRTWWETTKRLEQESGAPLPGLQDSGGSPLLYTVLGLLFKTPDYLSKSVNTVDHITTRSTLFVFRLMKPITNSRVLRPVRRRYEIFVNRGESVVGSLEGSGRSEGHFSRNLVRQQVDEDTLKEILAYLAEQAKLRALIAEQSLETAGDASTEIRVRSAAVDSSLDNIIDNLLRRQKLKTPPADSSS